MSIVSGEYREDKITFFVTVTVFLPRSAVYDKTTARNQLTVS